MNSFRLLCVGCVYRTRVYVDGENLQKLVVFFIFFALTSLLTVRIYRSAACTHSLIQLFPNANLFFFFISFNFPVSFLVAFFTIHTYLISQGMSVCVFALLLIFHNLFDTLQCYYTEPSIECNTINPPHAHMSCFTSFSCRNALEQNFLNVQLMSMNLNAEICCG